MRVALVVGRRVMRLRAVGGACALAFFGLLPGAALGEGHPRAREGVLVFFVSKSENRNQVAYAVNVDTECRPVGEAPVYAYWRMLERSPDAVEPLLPLEQGAYGLGPQHVGPLGEVGGTVSIALRALPGRSIDVRTRRQGAGCVAEAATRIADTPARLFNVYARLAWPFGVASLEVSGWAQSDGRVVREVLRL
jgi:hypothetical protein